VISSSQGPLPDNTQHSQQTNIHAPGRIRAHNLSRRAAANLRLRPRDHWDQLTTTFGLINTQTYKLQYRGECHWQARLGQGNVTKNAIRMLAFVPKGQENFTDIKM